MQTNIQIKLDTQMYCNKFRSLSFVHKLNCLVNHLYKTKRATVLKSNLVLVTRFIEFSTGKIKLYQSVNYLIFN